MMISTKLAVTTALTLFFTAFIWLVCLGVAAAIFTFLILAAIAAPTFWTVFGVVLAALVVLVVVSK